MMALDNMTVDSTITWSTAGDATASTLLRPHQTMKGVFQCPEHSGFTSRDPLDVCPRCEQQKRQALEEKRDSVTQQLLTSDVDAAQDTKEILSQLENTMNQWKQTQHQQPPQVPPVQPPGQLPMQNQPAAALTPAIPGTMPPLESLALQVQTMQRMQEWMLQQKDQECQALRQQLESTNSQLSSLQVENALLQEKLTQQEQRMSQEMKLLKLSVKKKYEQQYQLIQQQQQHQQQHQHPNQAYNTSGSESGDSQKENHDDLLNTEVDTSRSTTPPLVNNKQNGSESAVRQNNANGAIKAPMPLTPNKPEMHGMTDYERNLMNKINASTLPAEETAPMSSTPEKAPIAERQSSNSSDEDKNGKAKKSSNGKVKKKTASKKKKNSDDEKAATDGKKKKSSHGKRSKSKDAKAERGNLKPWQRPHFRAPSSLREEQQQEYEKAVGASPSFEEEKTPEDVIVNQEKDYVGDMMDFIQPNSDDLPASPISVTAYGQEHDSYSLGPTVASSTYGEDKHEVDHKPITDPYGDNGVYTGTILTSTGLPHGYGEMIYQDDQEVYHGEWRHGRRHGQGHSSFSNGDRYEGEYRYDQRHGKGTYEWGDGRCYEGEFEEDKRHGRGKFTWPNGQVFEGLFNKGKRVQE